MMETLKKKLEHTSQPTGKRVPDWQMFELHSACIRNAHELKEEAELLLLSKRYPRAVALAITAREELGKAQIVADFIHNSVSRQEFEDAFKNHEPKTAYVSRAVNLEIVPTKDSPAPTLGGTITYDLQKGKALFALRCDSLYVGWDGSKPITPQKKITPKKAAKIVLATKKAVEGELLREYVTGHIGTRGQFK